MIKIIFLFLSFLLPISSYADFGNIFQKNLGYGFKIVQTKSDISISYKQKELFKESSSMGGYYHGPSSNSDFDNIQNASSTNQREKKLIEYVKTLSFDFFQDNIEKIAKEYSDVYDRLVTRLRLTVCYSDNKQLCPEITIKSPYWYGIRIQNGYASSFYYVHKATGILIADMIEGATVSNMYEEGTKVGKSGLYVLSHNEFVSGDPYILYLLRNNGSRVKQFETTETGNTITGFELLPNKKIHIYGNKLDQIVSVKL